MRQNWNTCIVGNLFEQNTIQINLNTNIEEFWMWNVCDTQIIWKSWLKMSGLKFMDGNEIHIWVTCDFPHVAERRLFQSYIFLRFIFVCWKLIFVCLLFSYEFYLYYFHMCAFKIHICVIQEYACIGVESFIFVCLKVSYRVFLLTGTPLKS